MPGKKVRSAPAAACRYAYPINLDSDTTAAKVVRLVGEGKRVLELGCATGHMSSVLRACGCQVVGIEIDAEAAEQARSSCERVVVGDVRRLDLARELDGDRFDVIVAADVLEHVEEPVGVLRALMPYLRPDGYVVASIPNVAHGSVRLALLGGSFPYGDLGLLDRTHLRFFTRESVAALFNDAGLVISQLERQEQKIEESEVPFDRDSVPQELLGALAGDPDARTYQFVVVAHPASDAVIRRVRELHAVEAAARREVDALRRQVAALEQEAASPREEEERQAIQAQQQIAALVAERDAAVRLATEERAERERQMRQQTDERDAAWRAVDPLRQEMIEQTARLHEMATQARQGAEEWHDLASAMLTTRDELRRTQAAIVAELRDLKASLNQPRSEQPIQADRRSLAARHREYQQLVGRVRDVVRRTIQFGATVAVVNKGDEQLLDLDGRQGWHFPRTPDGTYAGHYPADAKEAIDQIDAVRAAGAGYLLFPATAFWWLDHYPGLREHLERHYRVVIRQDDACLIFALRGSEASPRSVGTGHQHRYLGLVEQVRQVARSILPSDATVAVVSRGDPTLLDLDAGEAWHYPRLPDGTYAGHYPADSAEAISQVEAVRAAGADYLLFPATAFWWLDHYPGLREHLEQHHRIVVRQQHVCLIYALQDRPTSGPCGNHAAPAR